MLSSSFTSFFFSFLFMSFSHSLFSNSCFFYSLVWARTPKRFRWLTDTHIHKLSLTNSHRHTDTVTDTHTTHTRHTRTHTHKHTQNTPHTHTQTHKHTHKHTHTHTHTALWDAAANSEEQVSGHHSRRTGCEHSAADIMPRHTFSKVFFSLGKKGFRYRHYA